MQRDLHMGASRYSLKHVTIGSLMDVQADRRSRVCVSCDYIDRALSNAVRGGGYRLPDAFICALRCVSVWRIERQGTHVAQ